MDPTAQMYAPFAAPLGPATDAKDPLGWALLGIPVAAGAAMAIIPSDTVGTAVSWLSLLASVALIGVDAGRRGQQATKHVVGAILLWIVFFPLYMHRRAAWGAPKRLGLAIVATVLFLGGAFARPALSLARPDRATVRCEARGKLLADGLACTIKSESGANDLSVCWDVDLVCEGGPSGGSAHACGKVKAEGSTVVDVPLERFTLGPACAKPLRPQPRDVRVELAP